MTINMVVFFKIHSQPEYYPQTTFLDTINGPPNMVANLPCTNNTIVLSRSLMYHRPLQVRYVLMYICASVHKWANDKTTMNLVVKI
jgi:hypothetical protein